MKQSRQPFHPVRALLLGALMAIALGVALLAPQPVLIASPPSVNPGHSALVRPAWAAENPVIRAIQPPEAYPRTWVAILGEHFGPAGGQVTFPGPGGRLTARHRAWSETRLEAEVPYGTIPGEVVIRTADGRNSNGFRFSPPCWERPVIRQISPAAAMRCQVVKILGCGFGDFQYEQTLTFNGIDATGRVIGQWSETELLVRVPDEATSGPVIITNKRRVPSAPYPMRIRDDAPEWERLSEIATSEHEFAVALRVREELPQAPPQEIQVLREHSQLVDGFVRPNVALTVTWLSPTRFEQAAMDPGGRGRYTIRGTVDPRAKTLRVEHGDTWQVEHWHNTSSGERRICHHEMTLAVQLPIGRDVLDRPAFNVWAPWWSFAARGAELARRVTGLTYRQSCFIYDRRGNIVRPDGRYELLGLDAANSSLSHSFKGSGHDPCREPNPRWSPTGELRGSIRVPLPISAQSWQPDFSGFPSGRVTAPLAGVPVKLSLTAPNGVRRLVARTITDDAGSYSFVDVPITTTLDLEVSLEHAAVAPPGFHVTYARAEGSARQPVTLRTAAFSNLNAALLTKNLLVRAGEFNSAVQPDRLDDVALTYAHVWQAWQTAAELGLTLDLHQAKKEPLEIRSFSPVPARGAGTYWSGDASIGPAYGTVAARNNVQINIRANEAAAEHADRPMNREWHEMGHHVQADIQGNRLPWYWVSNAISNTSHAGRLNPSSQDSWVEGFAELFSLLVARSQARDPKPGLYRMAGAVINLDINLTSFRVAGDDPRVDEEWAVASLLWDLVDSAGDEDDIRPMGIQQSLLNHWGIQLARPLDPGAERWPPVVYRDRVALDERLLMFLIAQADKIARARSVASPNAASDYGWIFDVHQLYRTLATMGVGQDVGPSGLSALDELFVLHGFFADTAPQNLCYDPGEAIGMTSNLAYTVRTPAGSTTVPAHGTRYRPAWAPEAYLRYQGREAATNRPVPLDGFEVALTFDPPYGSYDYRYRTSAPQPGRLPIFMPDPAYPARLQVTPLVDHGRSLAPFETSTDSFWLALSAAKNSDLFEHTFVIERVPWRIALPLVVSHAEPPALPAHSAATPTPPNSQIMAHELVRLINAERERTGRKALRPSAELTAAAAWYAQDLAAGGEERPDHSDRQGRTLPERLHAFGYRPDGHPAWTVGESTRRGPGQAQAVLAAWLETSDRETILDRDLCEVGVGHALTPGRTSSHFWVADFGCRELPPTWPAIDGAEAPSPGPASPTPGTTAPTPVTPAPTMTAEPSLTPTAVSPQPTPGTTPGAILFDDDFCNPASGWPSGDNATERYGYLVGRTCQYQMLLKTAPRYLWVTPRVVATDRFAIAASGYPLGAGIFGILFGLSPSRDRFYVYVVDSQRRYGLFRYASQEWTAIVPWSASSLIDPDFGNTLRLESDGGSLGLYVDGTLLVGLSDGESHAGEVGLYAEASAAGFEARFTRYRLMSLSSGVNAAAVGLPSRKPATRHLAPPAQPALFGGQEIRIDPLEDVRALGNDSHIMLNHEAGQFPTVDQ